MLLNVVEGLLDWFLWTLLIFFFLDIHHKNLNTQSQEYLLSTLLEYFVFDFCVETSYNIIIYYISLINFNRRKPTHHWMMISISVLSKYVDTYAHDWVLFTYCSMYFDEQMIKFQNWILLIHSWEFFKSKWFNGQCQIWYRELQNP